ncbi:hypothetical protein C8R47DRAFT_64406 [Mycena vitilis]|nr:hypothetical protein C8R47DRAFT_64406 [Mycena vitilis]
MANSSDFPNDTVLIPGPSFHVDLPPIDARHMFHFSRRLLIFRCTSPARRDAQLAAFKTGLRALLVRCPVLGGVIAPLPADVATDAKKNWRTILPGDGLELAVKDLRAAVPSFEALEEENFPPRHFTWNLFMPIRQDLSNDRPHAACKMQFSTIEGGTVLTIAMSHVVSDGTGADEWLRILIEEIRLANEHAAEPRGPIVGLDRSVLCNMESSLEFQIEQHPAYMFKPPPSETPAPTHFLEAAVAKIPVLLRLSAAGLEQLKADATIPGERISTHDALCALMWRTALLVRSRRSSSAQSVPDSATSNLFMPSSARRHIKNLPSPYVGNAVYQIIAALELGTLLSPSGLQRAAGEIRRAITNVTPALVESYMAFIRDPIASRLIDYTFMNGTTETTGFAMGTSMASGDVTYGSDWGEAFGPLVRFRMIGEPFNVVMPKRPDGSVEVVFAALPDEVDLVKGVDGFGKYLAP